jgi:hypothetical protein
VSGGRPRTPPWPRESRRRISRSINDDDVAIDIQEALTQTDIAVLGFDLAKLDGELGRVFLCYRSLSRMTPLSNLAIPLQFADSLLVDLARFIRLFSNRSDSISRHAHRVDRHTSIGQPWQVH